MLSNDQRVRLSLELAAELSLEWPTDAKGHPVNGFSDVQLTPEAREGYATTIGELDAAITLHLDTFRRLGLSGQGQPDPGAGSQDQGDGQAEGDGGKTFNRSKLVCDCYPERSIRVSPRQAARGPILCGICDGEFRPQDEGQFSGAGFGAARTAGAGCCRRSG
jgi:hypothetical protein